MDKEKRILDILNKESVEDLLLIYNQFCYELGYGEEIWDTWDHFDEIMSGFKPSDLVKACYFGGFNPSSPYFKFNSYGNVEGFSNTGLVRDEIEYYFEEIVNYILDSGSDLGHMEIGRVLRG